MSQGRRIRLPRKGMKWTEADQKAWQKQLDHGEQVRTALRFAEKADKSLALRSLRFAHEFERAWEQRTQEAQAAFWLKFRAELAAKSAEPDECFVNPGAAIADALEFSA